MSIKVKKMLTKSKILLAFISIGFIFFSYSCSTKSYQKDKTYKITVLHTNDHHGRFWKNKNNEYGMAARKTLIDSIRQEVKADGGSLLLLSGGDINTGVPESDLQDAEPDFKGMSKIGYDAMALGNHEFDNSLAVLKKQSKWANFPFLSANIVKKANGELLYKSHIVKKIGGLKIAIVGFTTKDTETIGNPQFIGDLDFLDPIEVGKKLIPQLKQDNDLVFAVTHMGHYAKAEHGGNAPGDVSLARAVEGLDIIVGGHSQNPLFEPDIQNGTLILQAYEWGKYVGRLDLVFRNGELKMQNYRLIPVNLTKKIKNKEGKKVRVLLEEEIIEDSEMKTFLKPFFDKGQQELQKVIGSSNKLFVGDRKFVRVQETNLGNLIALAQIEKTNSDLAVMNSGGIRADLNAGDITYKDVLIVQPFANTLCSVVLTGAELKKYLEVVGNKEKGTGAFPQFAGVKLYYKGSKLVNLEVQGKKVKNKQMYKISINSYIASGGDGYPKLSDHPNFVDTGYVDADMMREYISKKSPLKVEDYKPTNDLIRTQ